MAGGRYAVAHDTVRAGQPGRTCPPGDGAVSTGLDARLLRLKAELDDHARIARYLGLDFERPVRSLADGYPENAIALVGKITERLLKQLWIHHGVPGTPAGKTLRDLISGCRPYIRSHRVIDALHEIQRLRNRSAHDGYPVADEDGLIAVRRLLDVLAWYTSTGSGALSQHAPRLSPAAAAKAEFLAGLYVTLDFRLAKRAELSQHTVYLLFTRERGLRTEHVELLLSRDAARSHPGAGGRRRGRCCEPGCPGSPGSWSWTTTAVSCPARCGTDCQVVAYDRFMDVFVDCGRHVADMAALYPPLDAPGVPIEGDLLAVDEQSGEMEVSSAGDARELLARLAAGGGNLLIVGRPGSGKTTLLKQLVAAPAGTGARRYRFFFDLSLKRREESFADFVTRTLAPYMHVEAAYVFPVFCYFTRAGSVLCALDGFDEAVPETDPRRAARPVHRGRPGAVRGISRGDDLAGVVPGGLPAGAAAAGWHQPDVREAGPATARPGRRPAARAAVLGAAPARRRGRRIAAGRATPPPGRPRAGGGCRRGPQAAMH